MPPLKNETIGSSVGRRELLLTVVEPEQNVGRVIANGCASGPAFPGGVVQQPDQPRVRWVHGPERQLLLEELLAGGQVAVERRRRRVCVVGVVGRQDSNL
jgi:hypothetical protein